MPKKETNNLVALYKIEMLKLMHENKWVFDGEISSNPKSFKGKLLIDGVEICELEVKANFADALLPKQIVSEKVYPIFKDMVTKAGWLENEILKKYVNINTLMLNLPSMAWELNENVTVLYFEMQRHHRINQKSKDKELKEYSVVLYDYPFKSNFKNEAIEKIENSEQIISYQFPQKSFL